MSSLRVEDKAMASKAANKIKSKKNGGQQRRLPASKSSKQMSGVEYLNMQIGADDEHGGQEKEAEESIGQTPKRDEGQEGSNSASEAKDNKHDKRTVKPTGKEYGEGQAATVRRQAAGGVTARSPRELNQKQPNNQSISTATANDRPKLKQQQQQQQQQQHEQQPQVRRQESQEAAYLNQSASEQSGGSGGGIEGTEDGDVGGGLSSRCESTRRLTDDIDACDENGELGTGGLPPMAGLSAGLTKNLAWAVFASTVGSSFQHGYNGGVVNAPEKLICEFINQTYWDRHGELASESQIDFIFAMIVAIFCIGGCIGALLTALVADRLGRKEGLLYNNLLVLIASPLMASARSMASYELLILGRLLIGVNAGLNAGLAPLYLNEIAPVRLRGALGTIYQLVITISILLSNILGLPSLLGDQTSWPVLFAVPLLPAAFMLAVLPHLRESPKHLLLNQGHELQAQQALAWFRQTNDVQEEIEELRNERELQIHANRPIALFDMFNDLSLRRPLTIAIVIMLSQQFSGINAVLFYSTSIFRDAGLQAQAAVRATLGMSVVNVAMTLVSLMLVDRAGRRTLHMTGLMGMAATCLVLALCLGNSAGDSANAQNNSQFSSALAVVAVYVFIAMFASGPGAIPWFLVAELFPSNARPLASSIAVAVNWLANFTVSLCFLPLSNILHGFTFVLFAILLVIFYLFTYYKVPETRGATAEEISALFKH